ncbi:MAG: hypothetical protein JNL28_17110 [Planctomycetes bacterium]|nr:hypothetical protein [Planctomycetota bacterium]
MNPAVCVLALLFQAEPAADRGVLVHEEADPRYFVEKVDPDGARTALARGVKFLLDKQNADGSWGTGTPESFYELNYSNASFYAWKVAGGALCVQTLLMVDETPERRRGLEKAVDYILENEKPKRGNHWDIDNNWAALCVFAMLVDVAHDARFQDPKWKTRIETRAKEYAEHLAANQDPHGGWGYYEGPVISRRPTWSTSFSTALVVPALVSARTDLGWPVDEPMLKRAITYVQNCALPNGAYDYSFSPIPRLNGGENINDVKGSLSRIQVCNWARRRAGDPKVTDEKLREGLKLFFEHHRFLAVARATEVPHESYYRNAGYFYFFGHYFAARVINELPAAEREEWHAKLRAKLVNVQGVDGSSIDFPGSFYSYTYATSFATMALQLGLNRPAASPR